MPQLNSGGGDDFGANDEMISFKDEGEQDEKTQTSSLAESDLADVKSSLVNESDSEVVGQGRADEHTEHPEDGQDGALYKAAAFSGYQYVMLPDHYNGSVSPPSNKVSVVQQSHGVHTLTSLLPYSSDPYSPNPHQIPTDVSQKQGVHRPPSQDVSGFYPLPAGSVSQIPPPMGWFPHSLMLGPPGMHPTGIPHPAIVPPSGRQEHEQYSRNAYPKAHTEPKQVKEPKKPVIKKPLNAFMLYMKEMRAKVIAECTLKESAAINQILGRRWHALSREEQAKYYELARKERQLHMQLYPSWSARDNYGKKKKRKRDKHPDCISDNPLGCS